MRASFALVLLLSASPSPERTGPCGGARNLALNLDRAGHPSPLASDSGWGGGALPWEIVDGRTAYDEWAHGLAFTGGGWSPSNAGPRQATIDFGAPRTFEKVVVWQHGDAHTPAQATLEVFANDRWTPIAFARQTKAAHAEGKQSGNSDADVFTFAPVTGSMVRYGFDNRGPSISGGQNIHGWIYEIEVFGCDVSPNWN